MAYSHVSRPEAATSSANVNVGWSLTDTVIYGAVMTTLIRDCFSAPVRYYTSDIPALWFIPDALMLASIMLLCVQRNRFAFNVTAIIFISVSCVIGLSLNGSTTAVASGLKMILPLFAGLYIGDRFKTGASFKTTVLILYAAICLGVVYNSYFEFPWTDQTFLVGDQEREFSRVWWTATADRIAGFGADSSLTGFLIMFSAVYLTSSSKIWTRFIVFGFTIYIIQITTSKTPIITIAALMLIDIFCLMLGAIIGRSYQKVRVTLYWPVVIICTAAPFLAVLYGQTFGFGSNVSDNVYSFSVRAMTSWVTPHMLMLHDFPLGFLFGVGIGTVGYPVLFSNLAEWYDAMNQIDNFPFSIYLLFGIPGFFIYLLLLYQLWWRGRITARMDLVFMFLLYGITILGFGAATFCLFFGAILSPFAQKDSRFGSQSAS